VIGARVIVADGHGEESTVLNPADQHVVGYAPVGDAELVDQSAAVAEAFPAWSKLPGP
jgi:acyl-CoA reductase-like NAD-dependent aldehyde dehydrogenase